MQEVTIERHCRPLLGTLKDTAQVRHVLKGSVSVAEKLFYLQTDHFETWCTYVKQKSKNFLFVSIFRKK